MVGTFPLNVQEGSPQYTVDTTIYPNSGTTRITIFNTDSIAPISNACYTIQNEDGSKWCTFYVQSWERTGAIKPTYRGVCIYLSSNTSDDFPGGSICWCVWTKEYYDSLTTSISTVNSEINTLVPKVDDSFINATKIGDSTLRLTRNDGTTVDISFPESGIKLTKVTITASPATYESHPNELVQCYGSLRHDDFINRTLKVTSYLYGYISVGYTTNKGPTNKITTRDADAITLTDSISDFSVSGLLYGGAKLIVT